MGARISASDNFSSILSGNVWIFYQEYMAWSLHMCTQLSCRCIIDYRLYTHFIHTVCACADMCGVQIWQCAQCICNFAIIMEIMHLWMTVHTVWKIKKCQTHISMHSSANNTNNIMWQSRPLIQCQHTVQYSVSRIICSCQHHKQTQTLKDTDA